MKEYS